MVVVGVMLRVRVWVAGTIDFMVMVRVRVSVKFRVRISIDFVVRVGLGLTLFHGGGKGWS